MKEFSEHAEELDKNAQPDVVTADDITDERREEILDFLATQIVNKGLTTLALVLLESIRPVNFLGSQGLVFLKPIIRSVFTFESYNEIALFFEDRENLKALMKRIEELDAEMGNNSNSETESENKNDSC